MSRRILAEDRINKDIRARIVGFGEKVVDEVDDCVKQQRVVIVGMAMAVSVKQAKSYMDSIKEPYAYLEYGSYLSGWRERTAIKLWSGWTTFPLVFVNGDLIGGASDLKRYISAGGFGGGE